MSNLKSRTIFLVDDDAIYLASLEIDFLKYPEFTVKVFATGELCIEQLHTSPDIIVLDYHLDSINSTAKNGMETLDVIKSINPGIPVIILSAQDQINVAVDCMHHKAHDYVVKNETAFMRLEKIIAASFEFQALEKNLKWYVDRM
jgi:two-component system OmpR family response regulator